VSSELMTFRRVALLEGLSFLLLLFVAMPLKYLAGQPMAVKVVGWAHGVLFVAYVATLFRAARVENLPPERVVMGLVFGLLPFGTFVYDAQLKKLAVQSSSN